MAFSMHALLHETLMVVGASFGFQKLLSLSSLVLSLSRESKVWLSFSGLMQ